MQSLDLLQERISRRAEQYLPDALAHVLDDYRATIEADPEIQRLLFEAVIESGDPEIARCISEHTRKVYAFIRQFVEHVLSLGYLDKTVKPDAATWGYMSMILALQYCLMLNLSGEVAQVQEEMSRVWLRGLCVHEY